MSGCLGEQVAALVDGELDHAARERAQRHLAHCAGCRAEADAHRQLKTRLSGLVLTEPSPPDALTARLLALPAPDAAAAPDVARAPLRTGPTAAAPGPVGVRPVGVRPVGRAGSGPAARPATRPATARRRRTAVGGVLAVLGAALALGSPQTAAPAAVDPATDSFVVQHVGTTSELPRVLEASLTGGGVGAPR